MLTIRKTLAALGLLAATTAVPAGAQQLYPQTIYWGSGLIDIPVAWVSPLTGDLAVNYSGKRFDTDPSAPKINYDNRLNSQLTFSASLFGRIEGGIAAFSSNPEYGWFARGLLLSEEAMRERGGLARWLPGIAVGARNIGPYEHIDRFGVGYALYPATPDNPNMQHRADSIHQSFQTNNTIYGVATKGVSLADIRPNWPDVGLSFTVGYGNGLFKEHGDLDEKAYGKHPTGGLFYGLKTDFSPGPNLVMSLMAENNAWDYNLGASLGWRGLRAGLYWTEIGAGSAQRDADHPETFIYNYSKVAFTLGWESNIFALMRGQFLQNRAAQLERARQALLAEITQRQQTIASLELELNRYEAQNLLELEQRRAAAEAQLQQEREALRRLEERLKRIEQQTPTTGSPPPAAPPASSTP